MQFLQALHVLTIDIASTTLQLIGLDCWSFQLGNARANIRVVYISISGIRAVNLGTSTLMYARYRRPDDNYTTMFPGTRTYLCGCSYHRVDDNVDPVVLL